MASERKRALIIADLEEVSCMANTIPSGEACCREAAGYMAEAEQMLLHGFSENEKVLFNQLLARAADNMK